MIQPKSVRKIWIDKFLWLLIFFVLILSFLFIYLQKIDGDIKNYDNYHQKLEKLISLDHQFENFFLSAYRYIDYDEVSRVSREFEESLNFLKKSNIEKEFSQHIYIHIETIENMYEQKLQILERFKTLNSRVTNSIHYLYDLRRTIDERYVKDKKSKSCLTGFFLL